MRKRIYGLETEYALLFYPDSPGSPTPNQKLIYEVFSDVLRENYPCAPALYRKQGQFLSNSLLLHYEARGDSYYHGLIEGCTPECLSPRELITYQRALDDILQDLIGRTEERMAARGFVGRLVLGKNSADTHGNSYGCHENYLVEDPVSRPLWVIYPLLVVTVLAIGVPILWGVTAAFVFLLTLFLATVAARHVCGLLARLPGIGWLFDWLETLLALPNKLVERIPEQEWLKVVNYVMQFAFLPPVALLSVVLSRMTFRPMRRSLTSFLATRTVFTGSGRLAFEEDAPGLHLSQKAEAIRSVMKIYWDDQNKPIYDIKNFIFEIGSALRSRKRLHILFSDSNMSEFAEYLKIGTTSIVIRMIESGVDFGSLELRRPVRALRKVSRFGHGALLELRNGEQRSALQIQREYLASAKRFIEQDPDTTEEERDIVQRWAETLDQLDKNPALLGDRIDWAIKKRVMDEHLLGRTNWVRFSQWGAIVEKLRQLTGGEVDFSEYSFDGLRSVLDRSDFDRLERTAQEAGLDTEEFQFFYDLFFEVKKMDLRYHEISAEGGYYDWLRGASNVETLTREEDLSEARTSPPPHTRANIRGNCVARGVTNRHELLVGWRKIRNRTLRKTIFIDDPFAYEIEP